MKWRYIVLTTALNELKVVHVHATIKRKKGQKIFDTYPEAFEYLDARLDNDIDMAQVNKRKARFRFREWKKRNKS